MHKQGRKRLDADSEYKILNLSKQLSLVKTKFHVSRMNEATVHFFEEGECPRFLYFVAAATACSAFLCLYFCWFRL